MRDESNGQFCAIFLIWFLLTWPRSTWCDISERETRQNQSRTQASVSTNQNSYHNYAKTACASLSYFEVVTVVNKPSTTSFWTNQMPKYFLPHSKKIWRHHLGEEDEVDFFHGTPYPVHAFYKKMVHPMILIAFLKKKAIFQAGDSYKKWFLWKNDVDRPKPSKNLLAPKT